MRCEVNEQFPIAIEEEGTVMDYVDHEFVFVIKDETWTDFELKALKKQPLEIAFVYKYDIAIFLLTLEDAIDTSDFVFNVHDNDYDETLFTHFATGSGYTCTLYLLDGKNIVKGRKIVQLSNAMSLKIADCLRQQKDVPYREEEFICNLEGLQAAWEPFELQPMAIANETFK